MPLTQERLPCNQLQSRLDKTGPLRSRTRAHALQLPARAGCLTQARLAGESQKGPPVDARKISKRLTDDTETFGSNDRFRLHGTNRRQIQRMLARLTDYVETRSEMPSRYAEYVLRKGKQGYEVEHIWADHPERHTEEFTHESDFQEHRNRIGGLLLLPKSFNASYGDLLYDQKREHYLKQNILAQSLHELAYERNPGFLRFIKESGLPFIPHPEFKKADMEGRQLLYRRLAEELWSPARLHKELT